VRVVIEDARGIPHGNVVQADLCIVGTGAAGIPLALTLSGRGLSIVVLEGGHLKDHAPTQSLYAGEVADDRLHSPPDRYRNRRFGGSTATWGGRCVPFDPVDFLERSHVPGSGWPISYQDIARYYPQANAWAEAGLFEYNADAIFGSPEQAMFRGFRSDVVRTDSLERFSCPTHFGVRYAHRLRVAGDIRLLLGANCTGLKINGGRIESADVATLDGNRFKVAATRFVLASGGIESARLLLASNDACPAGIGNEHDQVGRYYSCHIAGNVGRLTVHGPAHNVRHGYEIAPDGVYCRRRLSLTAAEQSRIGAGNVVARLHFPRIADPSHRNGVLSMLYLGRRFISYEYGKRLNDGEAGLATYVRHAANVVADARDTAAFFGHWLRKRTLAQRKFPSVILRNRNNRFSLEVHSEQFPNRDSRITLCESRDALGVQRVRVDWRYTQADIDSVRKTLAVFAQEFDRSGIARLEFDQDTLERDLTRFGAYGGHHIGTTRMGADPRHSVVDRDCRVHSTDNLYVCSSSVFPTSSQANPTLTIIALALRLADHLAASRRVGVTRDIPGITGVAA
jgi:choline dehydrogenase-like flavoprotein